MKNYKPEEELDQRIDTLQSEIRQNLPETSNDKKASLLELKKRLLRGAKTFANPVYAEQFQQNCLKKAKPLFDNTLNEELPVCFSTINICQGYGKNKKTRWLSCDDVEFFNVQQAVNTLRKQLLSVSGCFGFITVEIKWDERFDAFLPHAHILSFGASATDLKKLFRALYPVQETKQICRSFYDQKNNRKNDSLALQYPNPIKLSDVKGDISKKKDFRRVTTYMTKLKTYAKRAYFKHHRAEIYKHKTYRPEPYIHNTHLLFLDTLSSKAVFTPFNESLMRSMTGSVIGQVKGFDDRDVEGEQKWVEPLGLRRNMVEHKGMTDPYTKKDALGLLGYSSFRSQQKTVISRMLKNDRSFFRLKTGFGKSLCFQVAALCQKGLCVVIEPLIAVMNDQVEKLNAVLPNSAVTVNSKTANKKAIYGQISQGKYRFLYVTPEMFCSRELVSLLQKTLLCHIVIDEAHCIAFYGQNSFRPHYLKMGQIIKKLDSSVKVSAFTGSTDAKTIRIIRKALLIPKKACFVEEINRPEITYSVVRRKGDGCKQLRRMISSCNGTVIIFCTLRDTAEAVASMLGKAGIATELFLGKGKNNADIIAKSKKERLVIVATSALCMGVDIPCVEKVIHFEPPLSLVEYCQGSGRAAREKGSSAKAVMMYTENDLQYIRRCFCKTKSDKKQFDAVCRYIKSPNNHRRFLLDALNELCRVFCDVS